MSDPPNDPPIRVGDVVRLFVGSATWTVVAIHDGKEGEDTVVEIRPNIGTERTIRVGYGAIRPAAEGER